MRRCIFRLTGRTGRRVQGAAMVPNADPTRLRQLNLAVLDDMLSA